MDQEVFKELVKRAEAGERVALCTVVAARGSTPQAAGAKMLLLADGRTIGTLGGGCVEAEVRKQALALMQHGQSKLVTFKLDHDYGWDDGLICGGTMDIYVQTILDRNMAVPFSDALRAVGAGRAGKIEINYDVAPGEAKSYIEELDPPPKLVIAGAGHVGQALAAIAAALNFRVSIIDDRPDMASKERFPSAENRIIGDIETELRNFPIEPQTYIVIVTRGHRHDGQALAAVIDSPAGFIGLIGSKRKVVTIFEDLIAKGISREKLLRVHSPIGLEIGAVTVPEIAISIAAELVAVRRGRENEAARPMKFDEEKLREALGEGGR